jgi:hypothetical protein
VSLEFEIIITGIIQKRELQNRTQRISRRNNNGINTRRRRRNIPPHILQALASSHSCSRRRPPCSPRDSQRHC